MSAPDIPADISTPTPAENVPGSAGHAVEMPPVPPGELWGVPATVALVAVNVAVFLLLIIMTGSASVWEPTIDTLLKWGADFGPQTIEQPWRVVTSMFLHVGLIHILMNMWVLIAAGPAAERAFGTARFLLIYFLSGLGGSCASLLWNPLLVSAGASGAIFGMVGAMLAFVTLQNDGAAKGEMFRHQKPILLFIGYNLVYGLIKANVDNGAHIGGLATGVLAGWALSPNPAGSARLRSVAGTVMVVTLLLFGGGFARMRLAGNPAIIAEKMGLAYNQYIRSVMPLMKTQDGLIKELNDAVRHKPPLSDAELHDAATSVAKRADVEAEKFKVFQVPDIALVPLHHTFYERAVHAANCAHALEKRLGAPDAAPMKEFTSELQKTGDSIREFGVEKRKFAERFGVKFE